MKQVTCAWCGKEYEIKHYYLDRKIRDGIATCCSKSCGRYYNHNLRVREEKQQARADKEAERLDNWMNGFDAGYTQAKHEYLGGTT